MLSYPFELEANLVRLIIRIWLLKGVSLSHSETPEQLRHCLAQRMPSRIKGVSVRQSMKWLLLCRAQPRAQSYSLKSLVPGPRQEAHGR